MSESVMNAFIPQISWPTNSPLRSMHPCRPVQSLFLAGSTRQNPRCALETASVTPRTRIAQLRHLLTSPSVGLLLMPCCFDALSARLVERAGFPLTFMSGFSTAAVHGLPDTGLLSYGEMRDSVRDIADSGLRIPLIADADTGYGNAVNARRTVRGYAAAGAAGLLVEDQVAPKRCGHTKRKAVVPRAEAVERVRAAVDAAREVSAECSERAPDGGPGEQPVIIARTDAGRDDFDEALERARLFHEVGADITFVEAPKSAEQMRRYAEEVPGHKLANMLEQGETPILPPTELEKLGFKIAAYPLTLLSASIKAQEEALARLAEGNPARVQPLLKDFAEVREMVGFEEYYRLEDKYAVP